MKRVLPQGKYGMVFDPIPEGDGILLSSEQIALIEQRMLRFSDDGTEVMALSDTDLSQIEEEQEQEQLEQERQQCILTLKAELAMLSEDIVQALAGEYVSDIEARKARFIEAHNRLRELEGKPPRGLL